MAQYETGTEWLQAQAHNDERFNGGTAIAVEQVASEATIEVTTPVTEQSAHDEHIAVKPLGRVTVGANGIVLLPGESDASYDGKGRRA